MWKIQALEENLDAIQKWSMDLRDAVLKFCAQNQININLPPQPQMNITQIFNDKLLNNGTMAGNINDPYYERVEDDDDDHTPSEERVKKAIETLDAEGTITEDRQWFAIYKVLTQYCGYPTNMSLFCKNIEVLKLKPLNHPCKYDNWRRIGRVTPHLARNVDLWKNNKEEHSSLEAELNTVAQRLIVLLTIPE